MAFVSRHRYSLVVALVLVCIGVSGVVSRLTAAPDPGPPLMIMPVLATPSSSFEPPSPSASALPSASPSLSRSPVARRSPSRTPSATPSKSPTASPDFAARLFASAGRRGSVRGVVVVENQGTGAAPWTVVVVAPGVRVTSVGGAAFSVSGDTVTFNGPALSPDKSVTFRFSGATRGAAGPITCHIGSRACQVTTRGIPG